MELGDRIRAAAMKAASNDLAKSMRLDEMKPRHESSSSCGNLGGVREHIPAPMRILRTQGLVESHYSRRKRRSLSPYEQSVEQWHADARVVNKYNEQAVEQWHADARARAHTEVHVQEAVEASPPQQKRAHPSSH